MTDLCFYFPQLYMIRKGEFSRELVRDRKGIDNRKEVPGIQ
jgi:hypothetical protein